jgi:prepilin-type N-terminal cleavage/methylation domain-containing protein
MLNHTQAMKSTQTSGRVGAFTLIEMLCVIAIIAVLAALLLPSFSRAKARAKRIECVSNLSENGLAFQMFANDHGGKFTTHVSTNDGGSLEFVTAGYQIVGRRFYFSYQHFRPLVENQLTTPNVFACPAELQRWPATNFSQFNNRSLSYAIGLKADPSIPNAILLADRTLPTCHEDPPNPTIGNIHYPCDNYGSWGVCLHEYRGNILFSDYHVEESYDAILPEEESLVEPLVYPDVEATTPESGQGGGQASGQPYPPSYPPSPTPFATRSNPGINYPITNPAPALRFPRASSPNSAPSSPAKPADFNRDSTASAASRPQSQPPQPTPNHPYVEAAPQPNKAPPPVLLSATKPPMTKPPAAPNGVEPPLTKQLTETARECWDAISWLFWLALAVLFLILLARWLDRRWYAAQAKRRFDKLQH